jgi:hypothetical protein
MTKNELIELLEERPFVPLRLQMNNGRAHEVRHPENAIVADYHVAMIVMRDGEEVIRIISLPHVNEVEQIKAVSDTKKRNGRKPRK